MLILELSTFVYLLSQREQRRDAGMKRATGKPPAEPDSLCAFVRPSRFISTPSSSRSFVGVT